MSKKEQEMLAEMLKLRREISELKELCGDLSEMASTLSGASNEDVELMSRGVAVSSGRSVTDKIQEGTIEDGYGSVWSDTCPSCGGKMQVVRPGKIQCCNCG